MAAPPSFYGESLEDERLGGGSFCNLHAHGGQPLNTPDEATWGRLVEKEVGHAKAKLYGGSQYHRALREFSLAVTHMTAPDVTSDEIANAAGMNDVHGENPPRTFFPSFCVSCGNMNDVPMTHDQTTE